MSKSSITSESSVYSSSISSKSSELSSTADTRKKPLKKYENILSRGWCITINNYSNEDMLLFQKAQPTYYVIGLEVAPDTGTKHIQGYIFYTKSRTFKTLKRLFPTAHIEKAKGSPNQNREYCIKDGHYHEEGSIPQQGARNDIKKVIEEILEGKAIMDIEHTSTYIRNKRNIDSAIELIRDNKRKDKVALTFNDVTLRRWQQELLTTITSIDEDDRTIYWVYDTIGNTGKTWFAKYLTFQYGAAYFNNSSSKDISYLYQGETICVFNIVRTLEDHVNYSILESLKDGIIISTKYECRRIHIEKPPIVIVFCNFPPNGDKLSKDRLTIINVEPKSIFQE